MSSTGWSVEASIRVYGRFVHWIVEVDDGFIEMFATSGIASNVVMAHVEIQLATAQLLHSGGSSAPPTVGQRGWG